MLASGLLGAVACAQPAAVIRFSNGSSTIEASPGEQVPVWIYATGLPDVGTPIPWTTPPGTGQVGQYAGFASVLMNLDATGGSWSNLMVGPGFMPGGAGVVSGSSVLGINPEIFLNPPIPGFEVLLWRGTFTMPNTSAALQVSMQPPGPGAGFQVALSGILPPPLSAPQHLPTLNGSGQVLIPPAPAGVAAFAFAGVLAAWRRRAPREAA